MCQPAILDQSLDHHTEILARCVEFYANQGRIGCRLAECQAGCRRIGTGVECPLDRDPTPPPIVRCCNLGDRQPFAPQVAVVPRDEHYTNQRLFMINMMTHTLL